MKVMHLILIVFALSAYGCAVNVHVSDKPQYEVTGNEFDVTICGDGYFQLDLPNGEVGYTRYGRFHSGEQGVLTHESGYWLTPWINVPENTQHVALTKDGMFLFFDRKWDLVNSTRKCNFDIEVG